MVLAGPTLRNEFEQLAFKGNAGGDVELSHKDQKNLWHTRADLPLPLVPGIASAVAAMDAEEPSIFLKLATIGDPVTAARVRRMHNGAQHKPAPKPAAAGRGAGGAATAATAARSARKDAAKTPLSPSSILHARAAAAVPPVGEAPDQQWGTARGAAVAAASRRSAAAATAELDAPLVGPTLAQLLASTRSRVAPAAAEVAQLEVTAAEFATVLKTVRGLPQVGDRAAAAKVRQLEDLQRGVMKAQAQLADRMAAFRVAAQLATDTVVTAATAPGYVAPAAGALAPVALGRAPGTGHRR